MVGPGGERLLHVGEFGPVALRQARVHGDDVALRLDRRQLGRGRVAGLARGQQRVAQLGDLAGAGADRVDEAGDPRLGLLDCLAQPAPIGAAAAGILLEPAAIFGQVVSDGLRIEQQAAEAAHHAALIFPVRQGAVVGAAPAVAKARASPAILAGDHPARPADTAAAEAGEQPLRPLLAVAGHALDPLAVLLDRDPVGMVDDAQVLDLGHLPFGGRVRPDRPAARLRIVDPARLVVDQAAVIELVLEDAVLANAVPVDRADPPQPAGRARHPFPVELPADHQRRPAGEELAVDAADDLRLGRVDRGQTLLHRAIGQDAVRRAIAIGAAAGDPAARRHAALAAADLGGHLLQQQGVHRPLEGRMERRHLALAEREQAGAGMLDLLVDERRIDLGAGDAVHRLGDDLIDAAGLDPLEHGLEPGAGEDSAADLIVAEDVDDGPALALAAIAADADLVLDRAPILEGAAVTCVDDRPHGDLSGAPHNPDRRPRAQGLGSARRQPDPGGRRAGAFRRPRPGRGGSARP